VFARLEREKNNELVLQGPRQGSAYTVGKTSMGAIRDFQLAEHVKVGVGALYAVNFVPEILAPIYGRTEPAGAMAFVRLKIE
jgi:hypothetical protein